ncbi:protein FAR1-RELATED SEQUENCE 5-like [Chenopodium quinoa]|uniref:protein FAR1-RELATED SEQUENCE 5-like n=1 Tax=Chenopodium quinoa TaxID=63459 RepID=UPI000B785EF7|nr:protein FAR1-RELATED SEQUENCE 5-like [Chenopodium quinoa]
MDVEGNCVVSVECDTASVVHVCTLGGTKLWIPCCESEIRPCIGMRFSNVDDGLRFYESYAAVVGKGDISEEEDNAIQDKEDMNEEEVNNVQDEDNDVQDKGDSDEEENNIVQGNTCIIRRRLDSRVGCRAKMLLKRYEDEGHIVSKFEEGHTHPMYSHNNAHFQKLKRKLTLLHKKMIIDNSTVIGPVKTYKMIKEYVGGYEIIGASKSDFKNFHRDLKAYFEGSDYEMDEDDCLCRALWADLICRKNYAIFGDMVSFDTIYQSNRYMYVYYNGVDNHKKCVNFAAGFIAKEDIVSFQWLFRTFLKAMGHREPNCLITDQDPAMKITVNSVFEQCEHRFCMWHITKKLPNKVGRSITQETEFLKILSKCVWNSDIKPFEFEEMWNDVLVKFYLEDHDWLNMMFKMRSMWIPAYFRDFYGSNYENYIKVRE